MQDFVLSRQDMDFLIHDWLDLDEKMDRATADAFLDLSEKLAAEKFLTHYKASDIQEPKLDAGQVRVLPQIAEALANYAELGFFAAGFPEEMEGLGLPFLACAASFAFFAAANIATTGYAMLTVANARLICAFGSESQKEQFAKPQIAGEWFGTMCLSEPQAGSSLADIQTRADHVGSDNLGDRYRLRGNKMWISGGDQDVSRNIVHLVLAQTQGSDGRLLADTSGLSLFIVPKILPDGSANDLSVAGLNHKMGYRGTANCLLNFGENQGATGWLVGSEGQGLKQMFMMMNEARISVGLGAAALACRAQRLSATYARERLQGRLASKRSDLPVAIIEHPDVRRMLLAQKAYAEGAMALCLFCADLVDKADDPKCEALLGLLTPVAKTWPSEWGLQANDIAIQVFGGYGYTRDFDVEQLWRDNRLNPIHEGTTGIQAIDLLGRKILRDGGALAVLAARIAATADAVRRHDQLAGLEERLEQEWAGLESCIAILRVAERPLDNATPFLWAFGHVVVAWIWLELALKALETRSNDNADARFTEGKLRACRFFFESELPKAVTWMMVVSRCSKIAADAPADIF